MFWYGRSFYFAVDTHVFSLSLPPSPPLSPFAGKGSSSISSDVSSSTDHTPTKAQKNAATSEGRQLVLITQVRPPSIILAIFRKGTPPPHSFCVLEIKNQFFLYTVSIPTCCSFWFKLVTKGLGYFCRKKKRGFWVILHATFSAKAFILKISCDPILNLFWRIYLMEAFWHTF